MAAATSSLPVPLSPVISTQASRGATRAMRLNTACMAGLRPTISSGTDVEADRSPAGAAVLLIAPLQGPGHGFQGLVQVERLGQVIEGAALDGLTAVLRLPKAVMTMTGASLRQFPQLGQGGQAVEARQANVQDDGVGPLLLGLNKRLLGRGGDADVVPLLAESPFQRPANGFFIVDDQDVFHIRCHVDTPKTSADACPTRPSATGQGKSGVLELPQRSPASWRSRASGTQRSPASWRSRASGTQRSPASWRSRASGTAEKPGFLEKPGFWGTQRSPASWRSRASGHAEKPGFLEKPGFWHAEKPGFLEKPGFWHAEKPGFLEKPGFWHAEKPGFLEKPGFWHAEKPGFLEKPGFWHDLF